VRLWGPGEPEDYPRLRPLEAIGEAPDGRTVLRDPTGLAEGVLMVGQQQLFLLQLLDGRHRRREIQVQFTRRFGQLLTNPELTELLAQLGNTGYLAGPAFERRYAQLAREYAEAPHRPMRDPNAFGMPAGDLGGFLDGILAGVQTGESSPLSGRRPAGVVVPHLDYPRGRPCYAAGFELVRQAWGEVPTLRVVIFGTNHFGRSGSVTATRKDFATPFGIIPVDRLFLDALAKMLGAELFLYELDHLREHSIELPAIWLRYLFGERVRIVPFLCPDPTGPLGTGAADTNGADLRELALALGKLAASDDTPTLFLASADLSHVGRYFGDDRPLDDAFLGQIREADTRALGFVLRNDPEGLRQHMGGTRNPTRHCSTGALYATLTALGQSAEPVTLGYHQAVTQELENCVTCAAAAFFR
jgi:AmmeMemoRadiSam system protein B